MRKILPYCLLFLGFNCLAADTSIGPARGTYTSYTEADWGVGFELKAGGKAVVITEYSYEYDKNNKKIEHQKNINGTWEYKAPHLVLSYGFFKDKLIQSRNCIEKKPCLKYVGPLEAGSVKSPLNVKYDFINWTAGQDN